MPVVLLEPSTVPSTDAALSDFSQLPFIGQTNVPDFIQCEPDLTKPEFLKPSLVNVTDKLCFTDRLLPDTKCVFAEN